MADFEDCFLYDATSQLRLRFNPKITSYKITTPQAKQNTIGGRFPFIFENRAIRYKEFPLSFLISYLCDQDSYFINGLADKYAYLQSILQKGNKEQHMSRYVAQQQTGANVTWDGIPNNTLTSQNIFLERQFKMAVLDWLTNGEPKIFKSPIEGNMVVKLINVSLTPEDKLGRMLHTCASTAVEVEEYTDKYLQKNNLLLYQAKSNKTFDMPFVPNNAILLQTITLSNGSDAYVYTLTNKQLIQQKRSGYYLTGRIIREGEDRN